MPAPFFYNYVMDLQKTLTTAVSIAKEAGALLRDGFRQNKNIIQKSSAIDLVTQYDQDAEKLITTRLILAFPKHGIIGEEGSDLAAKDNSYVWYVDPIDGTTNFAHGFPHFCVSLALYTAETPLVAVIYDPIKEELFTAVAGYGAHVTQGEGAPRPLQVSQAETLLHSVIATGFPYDRHTSDVDNMAEVGRFIKKVQGLRRPGSAALDLAYVAAGRLDGYWEYKLHIWDVAAGVLLVQEAGGRIAMMNGDPFTPTARLNLMASNHKIYREMLDTLAG